MRRFLGVTMVVGALVLGSSGAATAAPPPTLRCGDTVSGSVRLVRSLSCAGTALYLDGPTDLDLGGFTVRGPGRASAVPAISSMAGVQDDLRLTLRNGTVAGWGELLEAESTPNVTTTAVTVADLGRFTNAYFIVLTIESSRYRNAGAIGEFSAIVHATDSVLQATWIAGGPQGGAHLERTTIKDVPGTAIDISEGSVVVIDSVLVDNGVAISTDWSYVAVDGTLVRGNGIGVRTGRGPNVSGGGNDSVVDSSFVANGTALELEVDATVTGNDFRRNDRAVVSRTAELDPPASIALSSNTLTRNGDAIHVDGPSALRGNRAVGNTGIGIYAPAATDLGGNIATRNGVEPQCTGVVCARS